MKKLISAIALSLVLSVSSVQNSQAAIAIATGGIELGLVGLCVASYGVVATGYSIHEKSTSNILLGLGIAALGIIALDENNNSITINEIDAKKIDEFNISEEERLAFNSEKEEISLIFNTISSEATSANEAASMWLIAKENLSENAFSALSKLVK